MNATKQKKLREVLIERRAEVEGELAQLDAELESFGIEQEAERGGLGNHLAEDGSNVQEQERILAVSANLREVLNQIEEALARMDTGAYGDCQRCGKPINPERLEAFPYVAYCIECQTIVERQSQMRAAASYAR